MTLVCLLHTKVARECAAYIILAMFFLTITRPSRVSATCVCVCVHPANSEVGQNVTNAASGKKGGPTNKSASSAPPPPPSPGSRTDAGPVNMGSRKVDGNLVQSGVIDVDSVD